MSGFGGAADGVDGVADGGDSEAVAARADGPPLQESRHSASAKVDLAPSWAAGDAIAGRFNQLQRGRSEVFPKARLRR